MQAFRSFACRQHAGGSIVVTASENRGETWNRPGVVVGSSANDTSARRVMTLGVNGTGVLGELVVERMKSQNNCLRIDFSASFDGGKTFGPPQQVSTSSCGNSSVDEMAGRMFPTYGDYFGVVAMTDGTFRLMWPEMRDGRSVLLTTLVTVEGRATVLAK